MQSRGISQLPVLRDGHAVGSIQEVTLARLLHDSTPTWTRSASATSWPARCPRSTSRVHLDEAYRLLLAGNSGVLAVAGDAVVDIVTRIDLIQYWNRKRHGGT